jgi:hypothetical protein
MATATLARVDELLGHLSIISWRLAGSRTVIRAESSWAVETSMEVPSWG